MRALSPGPGGSLGLATIIALALTLAAIASIINAQAREPASADEINRWVKEAWALQNKGQTKEATPIFERALEAARERYGNDAVETAAAMDVAALVLGIAGQLDKAEPLARQALAIREAKLAKDHIDTAASLHRLGWLYTKLARYTEAEPLLLRSVEIKEAKLGKENVGLGHALVNLGQLYEKTDRDSQAEAAYRRTLKIWETKLGKDHTDTERAVGSLAALLNRLGRYGEAEPFYRRVVAIREAKLGKDHLDTATSLQNLGSSYLSVARPADGESVFRRAVEIRETKLGKDHPDTASSLSGLGAALRNLGRAAEAEPLYRRVLAIREAKLGQDHPLTAEILDNLAGLSREMARYEEAERLARRGLEIRETKLGKDHPDIAKSLDNLASLYRTMGRYSEAEPLYRRSLEVREAKLGKNHPHTASTLDNLGILYFNMGRYGEAEPLYRRGLEIREARLGKEHPNVASSLGNLATLYRKLGRYGEAEPLFRRSLAIHEAKLGKDHPLTASCLMDLGFLYGYMGREAAAESLYRRALDIREAKSGKDDLEVARSLNFLATLLGRTSRYAEAERLQRRCLEIREAKLGKDHFLVAVTLTDLAKLYVKTGRQGEAEPLYRRSLTIREAQQGKDHPDVVWTLAPLAALYRSTGRYAEAEPVAVRAVEIHQAKFGKDHPDTASSLTDLAQLYAASNRIPQARANFEEARRTTRRYTATLLPTLSSVEQRSYLEAHYWNEWSVALSFGLRHGGADAATAEAGAGWLANGKAAQQEAQAYAAQLQTYDAPEARPIAEQLTKVRQTLTKLKSEPAVAGQEARREAELDRLASQDRELTARLEKLGARTGRGRAWTDLDAIRRRLPDRGVLIDVARFDITDFKTDKRAAAHYVAWITPKRGEVRVIDVGEATVVDALVADLKKELATASKKVRETGEPEAETALAAKSRALAKQVLDPLLAIGEVQTAQQWILSPDGSLWLVPWAALPLPPGKDGKTKYVVEDYLVRLVTAGRDVVGGSADLGNFKTAPPVIVADPDFDLGRGEAADLAKKLTGDENAAEQNRGLLSDGLKLGRILRLPATAAEAESISQSMKGLLKQEPRLCVGDQALEAVVKATRHPQMLVLSTHGFFLPDQELNRGQRLGPAGPDAEAPAALLTKEGKLSEDPLLRCGLLLAACNDQPRAGQTRPGDDGVLTGLEVVGMDLRGCELVVLSACETGLGDVRNGEGVAGLRQAFQLAGAQSVVATLWQIPDRDSALLMSDFFEHLAQGRGKAEGLREAQLSRIKARRDRSGAAHPFFWAAFTLTGEAQSR